MFVRYVKRLSGGLNASIPIGIKSVVVLKMFFMDRIYKNGYLTKYKLTPVYPV